MCAITRDYLADPVDGPPGRSGTSRRSTHPPPGARTTPIWPGGSGPPSRGSATRRGIVPIPLGTPNTVDEPYGVPSQTFGWAAGDAAYAMGSYELGEDEALVIEGRSPACAFWNVCLWNQFLHTYDYAYERVTLNGDQAVYEPDGSWRLVVARRDPGPSQLDLDRRARPGPDLVPVVPPRGHPVASDHPSGGAAADGGVAHRLRAGPSPRSCCFQSVVPHTVAPEFDDLSRSRRWCGRCARDHPGVFPDGTMKALAYRDRRCHKRGNGGPDLSSTMRHRGCGWISSPTVSDPVRTVMATKARSPRRPWAPR